MHITKVYVSGFKSLVDFSIDLAPFNCLIGLNGCGKSTVLQFFDFLSHMLGGGLDRWFEAREWNSDDVRSLPGDWDNIEFSIEFSDGGEWSGRYNIPSQKCTREDVHTASAAMHLENGKLTGFAPGSEFLGGKADEPVRPVQGLVYRGSITTLFDDGTLPVSILELRHYFQRLHAFDTLSPQFLRRRDRESRNSIGHSGEHLSTFFAGLTEPDQTHIVNELVDIYPQLENLFVQTLQGGWKELALHETYATQKLLTPSRHINDGFLRLLAVLVEIRSAHSILLFDEIENGINPELVEKLVEKLTNAAPQVVVTTHSPMILNYLDDEIARQCVVFLHKGADGRTRAIRFFEIPSIREKLNVMGPGEAFVDTNLVALSEELNAAGVE